MEAHIQIHTVAGQLSAQGICRRPGHAFPIVRGANHQELLEDRQADEEDRGACQHARLSAALRSIDKATHNLRRDDLEPDAAEQEDREQGKRPLLGHDMPCQQIPIAF